LLALLKLNSCFFDGIPAPGATELDRVNGVGFIDGGKAIFIKLIVNIGQFMRLEIGCLE
jgi:hypothetical protein